MVLIHQETHHMVFQKILHQEQLFQQLLMIIEQTVINHSEACIAPADYREANGDANADPSDSDNTLGDYIPIADGANEVFISC